MASQMELLGSSNVRNQSKENQNENKIEDVPITFVRLRSAKQIVYEWFLLNKHVPVSTLVPIGIFTDRKNKKEMRPVKEAIKVVVDSGKFGFIRKEQYSLGGTIFYWVNTKCSFLEIVELFSHEIAHASGYNSENAAIKIASICGFSLQNVLKRYKNRV